MKQRSCKPVHDKYLKPKTAETPKPQITLDYSILENKGYKTDEEYLRIGLERDKTFKSLWDGTRPNGNESADDMALMNKLSFWCNKNDSLMRNAFLDSPHYSSKDDKHLKKCDLCNSQSMIIKPT